MNKSRIISCGLACVIQFSPAVRLICHTSKLLKSNLSIVSKWSAGLASVMGSINAVSGASTVITSPSSTSGKVGETFSYRITTAPDQANTFRATGLPEGLALGTTRTTRSFILGTPNTPGIFEVTIVASDDGRRDRTIEKLLTINILPNGIPPQIVSPPTSLTLDEGGTATFSINVSGTSPFTYQWMYNNVPIPGAKGSELIVSNVTTLNSGTYHVVVSNPGGSIESEAAQLLVNGAPHIIDQPNGLRVAHGNAAKFSVNSVGPDPTFYQWIKDGVEIVGETATELSIPVVDDASVGKYAVRIWNAYGEVTSDSAELKIDFGTTSRSETIVSWNDAWKFNQTGLEPTEDWTHLDFDDATWGTGEGVLFVEDASLPILKRTALQLGPVTYYFRKTFTINAEVERATLSLTSLVDDGYVLYLNGVIIHRLGMDEGAFDHETFANRSVGNASVEGPFSGVTALLKKGENILAVEVHQTSQNSSDVVFGMSLDAELEIPNEQPSLLVTPVNQSILEGSRTELHAEATGTGPLSYQWMFKGNALPGENKATLILSGVTLDQSGNYRVVVSNSFGSVSSQAIVVTVNAAEPLYQELTQVRVEDGAFKFSVALDQSRFVSVEYTDQLLTSAWAVLETKSLGSGKHHFSYDAGLPGGSRFYRVRIVR